MDFFKSLSSFLNPFLLGLVQSKDDYITMNTDSDFYFWRPIMQMIQISELLGKCPLHIMISASSLLYSEMKDLNVLKN